jgi:putative Mn2+ efflux pump MntP
VVTFVLSLVGVLVGHLFGSRFERPAQIVGGVVLMLIGVKVLLEHVGLAFWA